MGTEGIRVRLVCTGCNRTPEEIDEYVELTEGEDATPDDFVWEGEGTLNKMNGHFLCTECYIEAGMPESPRGWKAP